MHRGGDLTRVVGENQFVAMAVWVDIDGKVFRILGTKNLPKLIEHITRYASAHFWRNLLNITLSREGRRTIAFTSRQLNRVVAVTEMVNKLNENARIHIATNACKIEQDIHHSCFGIALTQCKIEVSSKYTGTKHQMLRQLFNVDRGFHEHLQLGVVGFYSNTVANLIEDVFVFRKCFCVLTRMELFTKTLKLFRTKRKTFVLLYVFENFEQFPAFMTSETTETRTLCKAHILTAKSCRKTQDIRRRTEVLHAHLVLIVCTVKDFCNV